MTAPIEPTALVKLTGDALPCGNCGVAVAKPDPATLERVDVVRQNRAVPVPVAKCPKCADRDREADELAREHLARGVTLGAGEDRRLYGPRDAARLLTDARVVLAAAGTSLPALGENPRAALTLEVVHLHWAARGLRFRDRLSPTLAIGAQQARMVVEPGTAAVRPWSHLDDADLATVRAAVAQLLRSRVALASPSAALTPPLSSDDLAIRRTLPVGTGCLFCGLGAVTMSAVEVEQRGGREAAARSLWTLRRVNPAALGGKRGPSPLIGFLCPACESAAVKVGSANSPSAMEQALATFLGVVRRALDGEDRWVDGLQGWGALAADAVRRGRPVPSPNATPWAHLRQEDLDALAAGWRGASVR